MVWQGIMWQAYHVLWMNVMWLELHGWETRNETTSWLLLLQWTGTGDVERGPSPTEPSCLLWHCHWWLLQLDLVSFHCGLHSWNKKKKKNFNGLDNNIDQYYTYKNKMCCLSTRITHDLPKQLFDFSTKKGYTYRDPYTSWNQVQ